MYFIRRLPKDGGGIPVKGKLRQELADMMCYLARVKKGDVVWDPFCGYGAVPEAVVRYRPEKLIASDIDPRCVSTVQKSDILRMALRERQVAEIRRADVFQLAQEMPHGSVNQIVTDPPWGHYEQKHIKNPAVGSGHDQEDFYTRLLQVFADVLKDDGVVVLLTARELKMSVVLPIGQLTIVDRHEVLVNGKKASIHILKKSLEK